jgi:probable HAF family extracellular repeat protein
MEYQRLGWVLSLVLALLVPEVAGAAYTFHTIDVPFAGTSDTVVTGLTAQGASVGAYLDAGGRDQGFRRTRRGRVLPLLNVTPQAINAQGVIVGWFVSPTGLQGFVLRDGTFTALSVPPVVGPARTLLTEALAINDAGLVVGDYRSGADRQFHGFLYDSVARTFTTVDVPGATLTALTGVNNRGQLVGGFVDAGGQRHAFRQDGTAVTVVTVPELPEVDLVGLTDAGVLAGNAGSVGFVLQDGVVEVVAVPEGQLTELSGVREDGAVYGRFIDAAGTHHGFLALPTGQALVGQPEARPHVRAFTVAECLPGSKRLVCRHRE